VSPPSKLVRLRSMPLVTSAVAWLPCRHSLHPCSAGSTVVAVDHPTQE